MTKEEYIKNSAEWQALNNIWKACLPEQKAELCGDFEIVSHYINQKIGAGYHPESDDEYGYLKVSDEAKQFVISLVEHSEPNIYHSIMAVLSNKSDATKEEIKEFYFAKYETKRPYLIGNRELVEEVIDLCWDRFHSK